MRNFIWIAACLACVFILTADQSALARVVLPSMFGDGMVIQRDAKICVWGKAAAHEGIKVRIDSQVKCASADANGDWLVTLSPLSIGAPRDLVVQGSNSLVVKDIRVGDVYLCSGQSNMALPLGASDFTEADLSQLDKLCLRMYVTPSQKSKVDVFDPHGVWRALDKTSAKSFPAIPYLFGHNLSLDEKIPIGIISAPCCGATLESFLPPETVKRTNCESPPFLAQGAIGSNFRNLLYPYLKVALKGVLWYQGESNLLNAAQYRKIFPAFICDLRKRMNSPDLPFFFVQLPNFGWRQENQIVDSYWADLRESQAAALSLPNVFMVVSIDTVADDPPLHPKEKREISRRLAQLAEAAVLRKVISRQPTLTKISSDADALVLEFGNAATHLSTADGRKPAGFMLAGAEKKYFWAEAEISGNTIKVTSDEVLEPRAVRYAWADNPDCNVCVDGQPLAPFRTDKWPTHPKLNPATVASGAN